MLSTLTIIAMKILEGISGDTHISDELYQKIMMISMLVKSVTMVPFLAFEYYLIMFENIFVDTSHLMSGPYSTAFLSAHYYPVIKT